MSNYVTREALIEFIAGLDTAFARPGRLYLIGETTHLFEKWRDWTTQIEFCAEIADDDRAAYAQAVAKIQTESGHIVIDQSPGDLIPLPDDYDGRARQCDNSPTRSLTLHHFDPYSVSYRFVARGDEPDYHIVLMYLDKGWITFEELDERLTGLLPRFTSETIQQDPAEFRRKYRGLRQLYRAVKPRTTHRPTAV